MTYRSMYQDLLEKRKIQIPSAWTGSNTWAMFTNRFVRGEKTKGIRYICICSADTFYRVFYHDKSFRSRAESVYIQPLDSEGKLSILPEFSEYARIGRRIVLGGTCETIEVWDLASWTKYEQKESEQQKSDRAA